MAVTSWSAQSSSTRQLIEIRAKFDLGIGRKRLIRLCRENGIHDLRDIATMSIERIQAIVSR